MKTIFSALIVVFSLLTANYLLLTTIHAQSQSIEVTYVYDIPDTEAVDGDILISTENGLSRALRGYDFKLFGVLQNQPVIVFKRLDNQGTPVTWHGVAQVNITTLNGEIKPGDYITSSEIAGKGMKATRSGHVIGVALDEFTAQNGQPQEYRPEESPNQAQTIYAGKVSVALKIEYAELNRARTFTNLLDYLNTALFSSVQNPDKFVQIIRYLGAALAIMAGFLVGFVTFSRSISKGVEAIGRNPLARGAIQFSIALNIILTILTALVGIVAAFIIINL